MKSKNPLSRSMATKYAKREKRWTLLFIGNHGKTITFYRTKEALIIAIAVVCLLGAGIGTLGYLYQKAVLKTEQIQDKTDNLNKVLTDLRNENEVLLARLVVAESRVEENIQKMTTDADAPSENMETESSGTPKNALPGVANQQQKRVSIDDIVIFHEPDMNTLQVQYKVVNSGPKDESVAGRTVVVLKTNSANPSNWLVLPKVPLKKGKPTGRYGKSFSIFKFRTMKFKANDQTGPDQFNTGIVYVFSRTGELMLEKDFPVGIKTKVIATPKKQVKKTPAVKPKKPRPPAQKPENRPVEKPAPTSPPPTPQTASDTEQPTTGSTTTQTEQTQPSFQLQIPSADQPTFSMPEPAETAPDAVQPNQSQTRPQTSSTPAGPSADDANTTSRPE